MTRPRGFTLLELMVALSLLTLLAGLMFGGFRIASRTWQTVDEHSGQLSETVQAQRFLRRLLARSESRLVPETRETSLLSFQGSEYSLIFISALPERNSRTSQSAWFYLALDSTAPELPQLILKTQPLGGLDPPTPEQPEITFDWYQMVDDFQRPDGIPALLTLPAADFRLSYMPREEDGIQAGWQSDWQQQDALPELMRITLTEDWPALVVSPGEQRNVIKQFK
ncbi:prepilin-type N-terminal cleavage/methylation domain-containing protein [Oceanimonas baumannii]|uniref:General secretion pathway protein GspJ n=1 Tax=Oceanimonas baumannii TaxID=129578 RepID=A0A235CE96_9GAMM|nr:prepilin-type N-terminal cleavage/methylation domain-containing protein [Oceanimonas baumannii]OYD22734.1 general secretion pathway protein GspJ [Oceanimonas baumannii]TDW57699.1 general secretion pathway protein J [Oceanimonas baumannii]